MNEKISNFHLEDVKNATHPSVFFQDETYDLFILRLLENDGEKIVAVSNSFIVTEDEYYYYNRSKDEFEDLKDIKGFYKFLDAKIDITMKIITDYFVKIEEIEDLFYQGGNIKGFNKQWFVFKNDLVRINRVLFKAIEAMGDLIYIYKKEEDYLHRNFADIYEHIQRAHRNSGLLLEKLDALYNFNLTQTNEQMNHIVYVLTLLSGVFLPLNFIVGFFGMNTTSLFFTEGSNGTIKVLAVLALATVVSTLLTFILKKK